MKRILLLLLFVVNLQITITDSAIGLRCGAVTHAQTMAREVNGGCEYSDGNGWSLWTPMPCDPVIANGYPCSYCHKGHDTDIQREIHIETECPEYTTSCPKCHTTLLRKELANHQCSGISNSSDSNDSNNGGGYWGGGSNKGGSPSGNSNGGGGGNKGSSTFPDWCGGDLEIPKNIKTVQTKLPAKVRHQNLNSSCFFASLANLYLLKNKKIDWTEWDKKEENMIVLYESLGLPNVLRFGFSDTAARPYLNQFGLEEVEKIDQIIPLLDAGFPLLGGIYTYIDPRTGREIGHILTIVGYKTDNKNILYCMDTDSSSPYGNYVEIDIKEFKLIYKPLSK